MKCQITSSKVRTVLINRKVPFQSFEELCKEEKRDVHVGFNNELDIFSVKNNTLQHDPPISILKGINPYITEWEIQERFFAIHQLTPVWHDCDMTWGWFDEELQQWTGCMGKVMMRWYEGPMNFTLLKWTSLLLSTPPTLKNFIGLFYPL